MLWSVGAIDLAAPPPWRVASLLVGLALLLLAVRGVAVGLATCIYAVMIATIERIDRGFIDGSDVLRATAEAIDVTLRGGNPYTHVMQSTIPVGSPFVYPPGEMLFYALPHLLGIDLRHVETATGILTVVVICIAGARAGWAQVSLPAMLYATWGIAAFHTTLGGNDVSAALLVVIGFVALAFPGRAALVVSAVAFGWALAFKQFAVLALPLALRHLHVAGADWRRHGLIALAVAAAMSLPFFLMDPVAFVGQQLAAVTFHEEVWGANLLHALQSNGVSVDGALPLFFALQVVLTVVALALALRDRNDTLGRSAILAGLVLTVPLLLAKWTTQPYYVYAATLALAGLALLSVRYTGRRTAQ